MKKLMVAAVAALSFMVLAQDAAEVKVGPGDRVRRGPRNREAMVGRGKRAGAGELIRDPAVWAVMNPKVAEKLGVSEEVREKIRKIDEDAHIKLRELDKKSRAATEKQMKLMRAETIDETAAMAAIDEVFALGGEMAKVQAKRIIDVKSLVTPEQLSKAMATMKEVRELNERAKPAVKIEEKSEQAKPEEKPADEKPAAKSAPAPEA